MSDFSILSWNVRGLNQQARHDAVRELISDTTYHLVCLQETKLSTIDMFTTDALGGPKLNNFRFKPAEGNSETRGGTLLLWDSDVLDPSNVTVWEFHLSASVALKDRRASFSITFVYGPTCRSRKHAFLREMNEQRSPLSSPSWSLGISIAHTKLVIEIILE
jgi:exonuclease III